MSACWLPVCVTSSGRRHACWLPVCVTSSGRRHACWLFTNKKQKKVVASDVFATIATHPSLVHDDTSTSCLARARASMHAHTHVLGNKPLKFSHVTRTHTRCNRAYILGNKTLKFSHVTGTHTRCNRAYTYWDDSSWETLLKGAIQTADTF